jgi:hypothetical protein
VKQWKNQRTRAGERRTGLRVALSRCLLLSRRPVPRLVW